MNYLRQLLRESGFEPVETEARAFLLYSALLGDMIPQSHGRFSRAGVLRTAFDLLASREKDRCRTVEIKRSGPPVG